MFKPSLISKGTKRLHRDQNQTLMWKSVRSTANLKKQVENIVIRVVYNSIRRTIRLHPRLMAVRNFGRSEKPHCNLHFRSLSHRSPALRTVFKMKSILDWWLRTYVMKFGGYPVWNRSDGIWHPGRSFVFMLMEVKGQWIPGLVCNVALFGPWSSIPSSISISPCHFINDR